MERNVVDTFQLISLVLFQNIVPVMNTPMGS